MKKTIPIFLFVFLFIFFSFKIFSEVLNVSTKDIQREIDKINLCIDEFERIRKILSKIGFHTKISYEEYTEKPNFKVLALPFLKEKILLKKMLEFYNEKLNICREDLLEFKKSFVKKCEENFKFKIKNARNIDRLFNQCVKIFEIRQKLNYIQSLESLLDILSKLYNSYDFDFHNFEFYDDEEFYDKEEEFYDKEYEGRGYGEDDFEDYDEYDFGEEDKGFFDLEY